MSDFGATYDEMTGTADKLVRPSGGFAEIEGAPAGSASTDS